ncbi:MAG: hypothetical protein AAB590_02985 [Patescibacteria group bacterium]
MATATKNNYVLTPRIREEIRREVYRVLELEDVNYDPDAGLELRESFKKKLRKSIKSKEKSVSLDEVMKQYDLK